jgi:hypothetical protein
MGGECLSCYRLMARSWGKCREGVAEYKSLGKPTKIPLQKLAGEKVEEISANWVNDVRKDVSREKDLRMSTTKQSSQDSGAKQNKELTPGTENVIIPEGLDRIEVQLLNGKKAYLFVPVPLPFGEKERLKKYIDLILEETVSSSRWQPSDNIVNSTNLSDEE